LNITSIERFFSEIAALMDEVKRSQSDQLFQASQMMADTIKRDGLIHLFGTGHSHMLAEELFYRAGCLANVNAILEESVMLHAGAFISSQIERLENYAQLILKKHEIASGDTLIVFSNSGRNVLPIEMALEAKRLGLNVIAITSLQQTLAGEPRHKTKLRLMDVAHVVIDNRGVVGDAYFSVDGLESKVSPTSTIINATIMQCLNMLTVESLVRDGFTPRVYVSANVDGGDNINRDIVNEMRKRIKAL